MRSLNRVFYETRRLNRRQNLESTFQNAFLDEIYSKRNVGLIRKTTILEHTFFKSLWWNENDMTMLHNKFLFPIIFLAKLCKLNHAKKLSSLFSRLQFLLWVWLRWTEEIDSQHRVFPLLRLSFFKGTTTLESESFRTRTSVWRK